MAVAINVWKLSSAPKMKDGYIARCTLGEEERLFLAKKDAGPLNGTTPGRREAGEETCNKPVLTHGLYYSLHRWPWMQNKLGSTCTLSLACST